MAKEKTIAFLEGGFLKPILEIPDLTDISFNGKSLFYMTNSAGREASGIELSPNDAADFIRQIANMEDRKWSYSEPLLDMSFGKYRLNAVFSNIVRVDNEKSVSFSIRIESAESKVEHDDFFFGGDSRDVLLKALYQGESIAIGGKAGSGKTELQKWMIAHLPRYTRVIAIDNVEELSLVKNPEIDLTLWLAKEEKDYSPLVKNALRSNPDYIVLAEARGPEAYEALNCAMSGHPVITTLHARGLSEMPSRIANMAIKSHGGLDEKALLKDVRDHFRFYVYLERREENGSVKRRIARIGKANKTKMETLYSCEK